MTSLFACLCVVLGMIYAIWAYDTPILEDKITRIIIMTAFLFTALMFKIYEIIELLKVLQ